MKKKEMAGINPKPKKELHNSKASLYAYRVIVYTVLIFLTLLCLIPFYLMLVNCSWSNAEIMKGFHPWFGPYFFTNLKNLFNNKNLPLTTATINSLFLALINAILTVYFSALTAYATHVYQFKLKKFVETFIIAIMMIPTQVSAMGLVVFCMQNGLTDNYLILILPAIASPVTYFFMKQYLESVLPYEVIEAARVDGTSEIGIFHKVVLPIIKPALAIQFIFAYVANWNNFFTPSMLINKSELKTIPLVIAMLQNSSPDSFDKGQVYMLMTLAVVPVLIVYLIFSKQIIKNLTSGSVKG